MFSNRTFGFALACCVCLVSGTTLGQEFRIETKIFVGNEKVPVSKNLTLFVDGKVYDFLLTSPEEITVLDPQRSQFILLDVSRKLRTTINKDVLTQFSAKLKLRAAKSKDPLVAFSASPDFEVKETEESTDIDFIAKEISYRVQSDKSRDDAAARAYWRFADWYARLNATRLGAKPPHARLFINNRLGLRSLIPTRVEVTIPARGLLGKEIKMHSEHIVSMRPILAKDRTKIEKAAEYLATFKSVSFDEYRRLDSFQSAAN